LKATVLTSTSHSKAHFLGIFSGLSFGMTWEGYQELPPLFFFFERNHYDYHLGTSWNSGYE
jgi:hypothetical protein